MPGYARPVTIVSADSITIAPVGTITSTNLQDAISEISTQILFVEGEAILGL
jgi:hypothetical protein